MIESSASVSRRQTQTRLISPLLLKLLPLSQALSAVITRLVLLGVRHRIRVELGPTDLRPEMRYVIAANHQSMVDPFVICSVLPRVLWRELEPFRFFGHNGLFESPLLAQVLLGLGTFPAREHDRYAYGIEAARVFLDHEQTVIIFPQGRRMRDKGEARRGIQVLAELPRVAVIPARIEWRRRNGRPSFGLTIGKPFDGHGQSAQQILDRIYKLTLATD